MEIAIPTVRTENFTAEFLRGWFQIWVAACNQFREWERQELINKRPPPETLDKHKKLANSLIRTGHMLQAIVDEPDYSVGEFLPEVQGKLMQLEDTREMLHNPISDEEAGKLLHKLFPDESGARRSA